MNIEKRDRQLSKSIIFLSLALLVACFRSGFELYFAFYNSPDIFYIVSLIVVFFVLLTCFLLYSIYKGKKLARLVYLVMFIAGIMLSIEKVIIWVLYSQFLLTLYLFEIALSIFGLQILYKKPVSTIFK